MRRKSRVQRLTPGMLRKMVLEEKARLVRETSDPIEAGVEEPEKVSADEKDADEQAEDEIARKDGPLVQQPETTKGDNPGVPANMKSKQPQNESEFVQTLKKLSGQI